MARDALCKKGYQVVAGVISPVSDLYGKQVMLLAVHLLCTLIAIEQAQQLVKSVYHVGFGTCLASVCHD